MAETEKLSIGNKRNVYNFDIALFIAVSPLIAAAVRIWLYSGGDVSIFLLLLRTLDIPVVLMATLVIMIPTAIVVMLWVILTDWKARDYIANWIEQHRWAILLLPLVLFVLIYTAGPLLLLSLLMIILSTVFYVAIGRFWPWGKKHITDIVIAKRGDHYGPDSIVTIVGLLIIFLIIPHNMWLPLERVKINPDKQYHAYVLESNAEWTTLLTPEKSVLIVPTHSVKARELCRAAANLTLATLLYPHDTHSASSCTEAAVKLQLPKF